MLPRDRQAHNPVPANLIEKLQHSFGSDPSSIVEDVTSVNEPGAAYIITNVQLWLE
jgi:hypothetical protein